MASICGYRFRLQVALRLGQTQQAGIIDFSIFTLPVDVQNTFATPLLIPVVVTHDDYEPLATQILSKATPI